jgi:hypothetical protein
VPACNTPWRNVGYAPAPLCTALAMILKFSLVILSLVERLCLLGKGATVWHACHTKHQHVCTPPVLYPAHPQTPSRGVCHGGLSTPHGTLLVIASPTASSLSLVLFRPHFHQAT